MTTTLHRADNLALLVNEGKVVRSGSPGELRGEADIDVRYDGLILPGLRDAHMHPVGYAAAMTGTTLGSARSLAEVADALRRSSDHLPAGIALIATRYDDAVVAERRLPTRVDLDEAVADRPTLVHRTCGHIAMANTAALTAAGIDASTPDPPGGSLDRDAVGAPNGVLRETAIDLVSPHLDADRRPTREQLLAAIRALAGLGITSIGGMLGLGNGPWASLGDEVEAMASIASELPIGVTAMVIARTEEELRDAKSRIERAGGRLVWGGIKVFADGSLGGHTAAMAEPYADSPTEMGTIRLDRQALDLTRATAGLGGMVAIHAIGDRANGAVLDHFESLIDGGHDPGKLRLEHASVLTRRDISRIAALGIVCSVQPAFIGSEVSWLVDRVGLDRLTRTYAFGSLLATGATLAAGSDCPVESPDPWAGMALARDRAGLTPGESLDAHAALHIFTAGGAAALGEPPPLSDGAPADFIVVDRDPLTVTPDELRGTRVLSTVVGGVEVAVDRTMPYWVQ
jgi:predicted amidohydrolase YtcJ